jgi:hypothetical protein
MKLLCVKHETAVYETSELIVRIEENCKWRISRCSAQNLPRCSLFVYIAGVTLGDKT